MVNLFVKINSEEKSYPILIENEEISELKKKKNSEHNYLSEPTFRSLLRMTLLSFKIMVQKH